MHDILIFILGIIGIVTITFPIGLKVTKLFPELTNQGETFFLSLSLGFVLTIGLWSFLITLGVPVKWYLLLLVNFFIVCIPRSVLKNKQLTHTIISKQYFFLKSAHFIPLCSLFLFSSYIVLRKTVFFYAPPDVDIQTQGFLSMIIKTQGHYPVVYPFLDNSRMILYYPPGFSCFAAILSSMTTIPIEKAILIIWLYCIPLYTTSMYFLGYIISGSVFIGTVTGLLSLNQGLFSMFSRGQAPEMMALVATVIFLFCLLQTITQSSRRLAVLTGVWFGTIGLIHTRFFIWTAGMLSLYMIMIWIVKGKVLLKDYKQIVIIIITGVGFLSPWLLSKIHFIATNIQSDNWDNLTTIPHAFTQFHSNFLIALLCIGCIVLLERRQKVDIVGLSWLMTMFLLIQHWSIIKIINPSFMQLIDKSDEFIGTKQMYSTPITISINNQFANMWYGLTMIVPLIASYAFQPIVNNWKKMIRIFGFSPTKLIKNIGKAILITLLLSFAWREQKVGLIYDYLLLPTVNSDYNAMKWFKTHTSYENTLILNPIKTISKDQINFVSHWIPAVSERKTVFFRWRPHHGIFPDLELVREQALWAYFHITESKAYRILKDKHISHVFIPAHLPSKEFSDLIKKYETSPYVEKVFESGDKTQFPRIYRVLNDIEVNSNRKNNNHLF